MVKENGCQNLVAAIIKQAIVDYKDAYKTLLRYGNNKYAVETIKEIEEFFLSDFFRSISEINGKCLLNKLKESLENNKEEKLKRVA